MLHVRKEEPLWLNKYVVVNAYYLQIDFVNGVIAMMFLMWKAISGITPI